jgi:hypothetical protein
MQEEIECIEGSYADEKNCSSISMIFVHPTTKIKIYFKP